MENFIAGNVRRYREANTWTQEELAVAAGISERTVQRTERGEHSSLDTLKALAAAFDVDIEDLRKPPPLTEQEKEAEKALSRYEVIRLERIARGADLSRIVGGVHLMSINCDGLDDDVKEDAVAEFRQILTDWADIWTGLDATAHRDAEKYLQNQLESLGRLDLVVTGARRFLPFKSIRDGSPSTWDVACVSVSKESEPRFFWLHDKTQPIRL